MDKRKFYREQKLVRLAAAARLYNATYDGQDRKIRHALLRDYLNDLRSCRKINVKQWELGRSLADQWHGTAEDFLIAIKELS
jgi:hypothetical protein